MLAEFGNRIRVGTFNVNGKMPSQDLAPWIGGRGKRANSVDGGSLTSSLKRLSFLADGGFRHLPLCLQSYIIRATAPGRPTLSDPQSVNTQATATVPSTSSTVLAEDDPDMLVLGFQELDLSTEALLYSTGTAREDAWCMAVFAGLGEKAILYEKVRCSEQFDIG